MRGVKRKGKKEKAPGHHPQGQPPHGEEPRGPQDTADTGAAQPMTIKTPSGFFRSSILKIASGAEHLPDPRSARIEAGQVWGCDFWTDEEVRSAITEAVATGLSIPRALDRLTQEKGRMPALTTIYAWLKRYEHFNEAMDAALSARGDILMDAATEAAVKADNDNFLGEGIRVKHFEGLASRLNPRFVKKTNVSVERKDVQTLTDEEIDRRIKILMSNKALADSLPVVDAEIIPDETPALNLSQEEP